MKTLIDWITNNPEIVLGLLGAIYEIAIRLWPTEKNRSLIDLIYKIITVILPNRVKDTSKIIVFFMLCSIAVSAQVNSTFKAARSYNADSLTVRTEVTGLQLMFGNVGALYYNNQSSKWRVFSDSAWHDLGLGNGGGGTTVLFGTNTQIPYMNPTSDNFQYSSAFTWNDSQKRLHAADASTINNSSWTAVFGEGHVLGGVFNDGIVAGESHISQGIAGNNAIFGRNNTLSGTGTKNFNLIVGDANVIDAASPNSSNYNLVSGNGNIILDNVSNSAIIATNGVSGAESNTLYTGSIAMDGKLVGNITDPNSVITVNAGGNLLMADVANTAFVNLAQNNITLGSTTSELNFTDGTIGRFNSGVGVGSLSTDITSPQTGDIWYNTTLGKYRGNVAGTNVNLSAGGTTGQIQFNTTGSFNASANLVYTAATSSVTLQDNTGLSGRHVFDMLTGSGGGLRMSQYLQTGTTTFARGGFNSSGVAASVSSDQNVQVSSGSSTEIISSGVGSGSLAGLGVWIHTSSSGSPASVKISNNSSNGNIILNARDGGGTGNIIFLQIPTSSAGLPSGAIWSNAGVLTIVP